MKKIIVYGSEYGTTKEYATKFSQMSDIPVADYERVGSLREYDLVIYFGGLYAGGVKGLKKSVKSIKDTAKLIIATVGLADVNDVLNTDHIKKSIEKQLPKVIFKSAKIFHLRGGIDYRKLNLKHRTMMRLLYQKAKNLPEEKKTAEVKAMIETYNQKVDFVDFEALKPILEAALQLSIYQDN